MVRLTLETGHVHTSSPQLRGVWGAALHDLYPHLFKRFFIGERPSGDNRPLFVIRPGAATLDGLPTIDWIIFGEAAEYVDPLFDAWVEAASRGLGKNRIPFRIINVENNAPLGRLGEQISHIGELGWPCADQPCILQFPSPLRIIKASQLVTKPSLGTILQASLRRCSTLVNESQRDSFIAASQALIEDADFPKEGLWRGDRSDLVRYSGRQKREIQINGVSGCIELPEGPGVLWPLIAPATVLHIGKSTVVGMGQMLIKAR